MGKAQLSPSLPPLWGPAGRHQARTIQELAKRLEKVEAREAHVAELESRAGRVETLEREVADLKKLVAQLAEAGKSSRQAAVAAPQNVPGAALVSLQGTSANAGLDR